MGGLGNQLFQIFTTMSLSIEMNTKFAFPSSKMSTDKRSVTYWNNFLKELKKNASIKDIKLLNYHLYKENDFKYTKINVSSDMIQKSGGEGSKFSGKLSLSDEDRDMLDKLINDGNPSQSDEKYPL